MSLQMQRFQSNKNETEELLGFSKMASFRHKESVRRSLFGPVDHDKLRQDLKQRLKEISEQDNQRWNFDFQTETPLPGRFQWVEIQGDSAADFHQQSSQTDEAAETEILISCEETTNQENCSSISNTPKKNTEVTPVRVKRKLTKTSSVSRNNARITDFFVKRRKTSEVKVKFLHTSSTEALLCKTIR
ncbi:cyclin dependent kinase inhibitor 1Ca [Synchiropus picturatus]